MKPSSSVVAALRARLPSWTSVPSPSSSSSTISARAFMLLRRDLDAPAHAGDELGRGVVEDAGDLDRLAHGIDAGAERRDMRGVALARLVDTDRKAIAGLEPSQPAGVRDELDLKVAVVEHFEQGLSGGGVLEFASLLLDGDPRKRRNDRAFRHRGVADRHICLRLLDLGLRDIELELTNRLERGQATVDGVGLLRREQLGADLLWRSTVGRDGPGRGRRLRQDSATPADEQRARAQRQHPQRPFGLDHPDGPPALHQLRSGLARAAGYRGVLSALSSVAGVIVAPTACAGP